MADPNVYLLGKKGYINALVNQFIVSGSRTQSDDPKASFHWTITLENSDQIATILDLAPGADGITGVLMVKGVDYVLSGSTKAHLTFECLQEVTAGNIVKLLSDTGRTRYQYAANGTGCRFWCGTILQDLAEGGYIVASAADSFSDMIARGHASDPLSFPIPSGQGTFY
jgi:hypothetical protein